jgi:hypothetical protein
VNDPTLSGLYELLYGWPHAGMVRAGNADPFSGFLLVGARIDALASLIYDSEPGDRKSGKRYSRFVTEFFPSRYRDLGLGPILWADLRSMPLHFLSSTGKLALADSQPDAELHQAVEEPDRIFLHWPEFLRDYETARDRLWEHIQKEADAKAHALAALREHPPLRVQTIQPAHLTRPTSTASAYGGPVVATSFTVTHVIENVNIDQGESRS